jgi:hypothetical protein
MPTPIAALDPRRGRPRKFEAPSKAVTLTLPNTAIAALADIDPDISRAVVSLIQSVIPREPQAPAELATFGKSAVIIVRPTPALEERTGVKLIPLSWEARSYRLARQSTSRGWSSPSATPSKIRRSPREIAPSSRAWPTSSSRRDVRGTSSFARET